MRDLIGGTEVTLSEFHLLLGRLTWENTRCDLDLVRDWAKEIHEELLNPGQRNQHVRFYLFCLLPHTLIVCSGPQIRYLGYWDTSRRGRISNSLCSVFVF